MIKKIKSIGNLATFKNFNWDLSVKDKYGVKEFLEHNIIYGRNYSGKTTISRIVRALENGVLSDKYDNPQFAVVMEDGSGISEISFTSNMQNIRVFNEDFVKDNLRFIANPDDDAEPFAILGESNSKIEEEIAEIKAELGIDEEGKETGLYKQQKDILISYKNAVSTRKKAQDGLEKELSTKALDKKVGIKYKSEVYGDVNYNTSKLYKDIDMVIKNSYTQLRDDERKAYQRQTQENPLPKVDSIPSMTLVIPDLSMKTKKVVEKVVGQSGKIEELMKDAILNKWIQEGFEIIHSEDHTKCAFCGEIISKNRWAELEKHFDEESKNLENEIDQLLEQINQEKNKVQAIVIIESDKFYNSFHEERKKAVTALSDSKKSYIEGLTSLQDQLEKRRKNILIVDEFTTVDTNEKISEALSTYNKVVKKTNDYTATLSSTKKTAQGILRLDTVFDFITTIDYQGKKQIISNLEKKENEAHEAVRAIDGLIINKLYAIKEKESQRDDSEAGAAKVNGYLNHYFGHQYIKFEPKRDDSDKVVRFEIQRNGLKAYHLSEGEQSLIAFCYFIAKLDDTATKGLRPIIWIDDPISSLDQNHIFFIYSLIKNRVVDEKRYKQLFISTHNLDFLRYIRNTNKFKPDKNKTIYFIVERNNDESIIKLMPKYMRDHTTEYNYIFDQIYKCSKEAPSNDNYKDYYCFANNARRFLEVHLYYRYPDGDFETSLKSFFGNDDISSILSYKLSNDGSHNKVVENGLLPYHIAEAHSVACKIVKKLKENDIEQYKSLLKSIGVMEEGL